MSLTRKSFVGSLGVASASVALASLSACGGQGAGGTDPTAAPAADKYPLDAEEWGSGTLHYTTEVTADGWTRVSNEGGAELGVSDASKLIQVGGYAFKDLNGNGKLDLWEDWRQDSDARAEDLASQLDADELLPELMVDRQVYISGNIGSRFDDTQKACADAGMRQVQGGYFSHGGMAPAGAPWARWSNKVQAYCEASHNGIPMHFYADPYNVPGAEWPSSVGLAATFDPQAAAEYGRVHAREYRAVGVHTVLGPQMDTMTEPRWSRAEGTFGEDPALSRDMAKAEVEALQESDDGDGWGSDSVVAMVKHWPGDGAGMFGWESHNRAGRFSVYPNGNFPLQLIPFVDGAFQLEGKTGHAAAVMPSYTISFSKDEEWGENVGTAFSDYKMSLLRKNCDYDELACSDWQVLDDGYHTWGVDDLTPAERAAKGWKAGVDSWGGQVDQAPLQDGYKLLQKELGDDKALELIRGAGKRVFRNSFRLGLFDNPYLDPETSRAVIDDADSLAKSHEISVRSVVMLKNKDSVIAKSSGNRPKVYIPKTYTASYIENRPDGQDPIFHAATFELPVDEEVLAEYVDLVTDSVAETLTGDPGEDGAPTIAEQDLIRATAADVADCDMALVFVRQPQNKHNADGKDGDKYIPVSMLYRPYVADGESGCPQESPAGAIDASGAIENLSPFGNESMISNEGDLDNILLASQLAGAAGKPTVVCVKSTKAGMIFSEFEPEVDAILYGFGCSYQAFLDIACGNEEPSGLLPFQMPANMKVVEEQATDTPRDMQCYEDSEGNEYDFGFGLNWSGVISDERTQKYCVEPLTKPQGIEI